MNKTVRYLLLEAASQFSGSDSASLDAQLLLADVLGKDRTWLFTWDDAEVSEQDQIKFNEFVVRRVRGEPIAHILGCREFYGLSLESDASTLIPRPETELLVEQALGLSLSETARVLDLGTGTGAIALALASQRPLWHIQAVDFSVEAVALAKRNRERTGLTNVDVFQSNWFEKLGSESNFDLIVSNPPYIDPASHYLTEGDVRFEPRSALIADKSGMADIELISSQAVSHLAPNGWLMIEHGFDQQDRIQHCFTQSGLTQITTIKDLAGLPRVTVGKQQN